MKKLFFLLVCILQSQSTYQGQVIFEYSGTENGLFTSTLQDSTTSGFSLNQNSGDSSSFLIASITQQNDNQFDLFLVSLQDTTYPIQPRIWDIPGQGDEDNPLSLETLVIFMPGLDSSFVLEMFNAITDTSENDDSTDIFSDLFSTFSSSLYLGLQGELEIETVTDSSIVGSFNSILIKPAFYFPPHTIFISDGEFEFYNVGIPLLKNANERGIPKHFELKSVYPNPFNSTATIEVLINSDNLNISLSIIDITGKTVQKIINKKMEAGKHFFKWNSNKNPSGIYFSVLKTDKSIKTKKLMLIK